MPKLSRQHKIITLAAALLISVVSIGLIVSEKTIADDPPLGRVLSAQYEGGVRLRITDPQNRVSGIDPTDDSVSYDIPDSEIYFSTDQGAIALGTLEDGDYEVEVYGIYDEDFDIEVNYMDANDAVGVFRLQGFNYATTNNPPTFTITLAEADLENPITLSYEPTPPQNFLTEPVAQGQDLKTKLTWDIDPEATSYNIYYKAATKPFFQYLGQTVSSFYQTDQDWVIDDSDQTFYAVTAVDQTGDESFFSSLKGNNDRDFDRLTDFRETGLGTSLTNPDTDSDQLTDYQEVVKYFTNPLLADTDGDTFSDYTEVENGSDPNDPDSVPDLGGCVPPASGDWAVTESCTLDEAVTAPGDVIVLPEVVLTIDATGALDIDMANYKLLVKNGGGVLIKQGGKVE